MVAIAILAGCSDPDYRIVPVSGAVTLDGKPVPDALVAFEPRAAGGKSLAGPGSYAKTDDQGRFRLETLYGQDGAVVATHDVSLTTRFEKEDDEGNPIEVTPERIPQRYRDDGELTFTVPPKGTDAADFRLESAESP